MEIKYLRLLAIFLVMPSACFGGDLQVHTSLGVVEGKRHGDILEYLGIPYAQPPLGQLRWADPQPALAWDGVLKAKTKGHACIQWATGLLAFSPSEDCLTLNIWAPDNNGPHPVMFWIHGGAQAAGSSNELQYDGKKLAESQNVVVVSVNYRLLISGFFALPALGSGEALYGNQAVKDLIVALQWVQDEISQFGGDPNNVTVFGESAGASNVCALLATPKTRIPSKLLHKVIMQSGACDILGIMSLEQAQQEGLDLLAELGCLDVAEPLVCARNLPIMTILNLKKYDLFKSFGWNLDEWPFRIGFVVDGDLFPVNPIELLKENRADEIPLLIGSNKDEGSLFAGFMDNPDSAEAYAESIETHYPGHGVEIVTRYPYESYPTTGQALADVRGDAIIKCPTMKMAQLYSDYHNVWMYSLEHDVRSIAMSIISYGFGKNPPKLGTYHMADVGYLFDFPLLTSLLRRSDMRVRDLFQQAWGNFARTGNPNGPGVPRWNEFHRDQNNYLVLSSSPENRDDFRGGACDYWFAKEKYR